MFVYADESGHSGRYIFNDPTYYFQGAILSIDDPEPLLQPVAERYRNELKVERIHANELMPHIVERIGSAFLSLLKDVNWSFHITVIEKPFLSITKFVDTLFDSYENKGARWLWYNHQYFRHLLCVLFNMVLSEKLKRDFWEAYLNDDHKGITTVVQAALNILDDIPIDKRLYQVSKEGLLFALKHPEEITLMASKTKKSYKGHTPNMIAFASLIQSVHKFCKDYDVVPEAFIHDPQSEFGPTMREYHTLLANLRVEHSKSGLLLDATKIDYDLGKFSLIPSKNLTTLQAVDVFLWLIQREKRIKSEGLKQALWDRTDPYYISSDFIEMSVNAWLYKISNRKLTEDQIKRGEEILKEMENIHFERIREFEEQKLLEDN